ncbi:hypothetical protein [Acidisphaera sp. L21]|uniref:hypothetical protein n=1 Tax=Acidisphaera sp. L21 TaxID=1641851 RepID=UPI001C20B4D8|nr:hypothetical protein [Acidisphaera sp. L21]
MTSKAECELVAPFFDAEYYAQSNQAVLASGVDPLAHFMSRGWREGRDPSAEFSLVYYLRMREDIAAAGVNPLLHYAMAGRAEGLATRRGMDAERRLIESARAPSDRGRDWAAGGDRGPACDASTLRQRLADALDGRAGLVVSISHDDVEANVGGLQNVVGEERLAFERLGYVYLHLSPALPLPTLAPKPTKHPFHYVVRAGRERLGLAESLDLTAILRDLRDSGVGLFVIVHQLLGNAPEIVADIAKLSTIPVVAWAHDYFTICSNFNLLSNDVRFCGAPPTNSGACGICVYGADRLAERPRVQLFFSQIRPRIIAPSDVTLAFWLAHAELSHSGAAVQPLARLILGPATTHGYGQPGRSLRIAHLGHQSFPKGWPVFERLAARFGSDPRYDFFHLGQRTRFTGKIRHIPVRVTRDAPDAMLEKVAELAIDVVVNWAPWPETFCYAAHEAIAGGAFLLTCRAAGHVPRIIADYVPEQGLVLDNEQALLDLFEDQGLRAVLDRATRRRGLLLPQGGTADWLVRSKHGDSQLRAPDFSQDKFALEAPGRG